VGEFFMLDKEEMEKIISEVRYVISDWTTVASSIGIPKKEQERMSAAFKS